MTSHATPSELLSPGPFEDLLHRATRRLAADPELRLEVAHELRGHLEDAAREYRAAGSGDAEAVEQASKALGDVDELAGQLWSSNRRRMRRRATARWTARLTFAPAAAVVCATAVYGALTAWALLVALSGVTGFRNVFASHASPPDLGLERLARRAWEQALARTAEEDRFFIQGPPGAAEVEAAEAISRRWPQDPALYANLVSRTVLTTQQHVLTEPAETDPAALERLLRQLDVGAQREPDNAFYPLIKAAALMAASSTLDYKLPEEDRPGYPATDEDGRPTRRTVPPIRVVDQATFDRGVAALHEAASKPYLESYAVDVAKRRLDRLAPPTRLGDQLLRQLYETMTLLPHLSAYWHAGEYASAYAVALASRGDAQRPQELAGDLRRLGLMAAERSKVLVELHSAFALEMTAQTAAAISYQELGPQREFEQAERRLQEMERTWPDLRRGPHAAAEQLALRRDAGVTQSLMTPAGADLTRIDLAPGRRAEYAVADQAGVSALVAALLLAAGGQGLVVLAGRWRRRARVETGTAAAPEAAAVSIGWKQAAGVVLLAGVLPLGAYAVYAWLTPLGGRGRGFQWTWQRVALEYAAVAAVIVVLLRVLTERAVRVRAAQLGLAAISPPPRPRRGAVVLGVGLAAAVAACVAGWQVTSAQTIDRASDAPLFLQAVTAALGALAGTYALWWLGAGWAAGERVSPEPPAKLRWRNIIAAGCVVAAVTLAVAVLVTHWRSVPRTEPDTFITAVALAALAATAVAAWVCGASGVWRALRGLGPSPAWRLTAGASLVTFAATALAVAFIGIAALRWEERREVSRFTQAGLDRFGELDHSRFRVIRERSVQELRSSPASRPAGGAASTAAPATN